MYSLNLRDYVKQRRVQTGSLVDRQHQAAEESYWAARPAREFVLMVMPDRHPKPDRRTPGVRREQKARRYAKSLQDLVDQAGQWVDATARAVYAPCADIGTSRHAADWFVLRGRTDVIVWPGSGASLDSKRQQRTLAEAAAALGALEGHSFDRSPAKSRAEAASSAEPEPQGDSDDDTDGSFQSPPKIPLDRRLDGEAGAHRAWLNQLIAEHAQFLKDAEPREHRTLFEWAVRVPHCADEIRRRFVGSCQRERRRVDLSRNPLEWARGSSDWAPESAAAGDARAQQHETERAVVRAAVGGAQVVGKAALVLLLKEWLGCPAANAESRAAMLLDVGSQSTAATGFARGAPTLYRLTRAVGVRTRPSSSAVLLPRQLAKGARVALLGSDKDRRGRRWAEVREAPEEEEAVQPLHGWMMLAQHTELLRVATDSVEPTLGCEPTPTRLSARIRKAHKVLLFVAGWTS